jgi:hypothetical protein
VLLPSWLPPIVEPAVVEPPSDEAVGAGRSSVIAVCTEELPVNVAAARTPNPTVPATPATTAPVVRVWRRPIACRRRPT